MEVIEFFFGNFWHWLELVVVVGIIFCPVKYVGCNKDKE